MSNHLNRILELRRLAEQKRQEAEAAAQAEQAKTPELEPEANPAPAVSLPDDFETVLAEEREDEAALDVGTPSPAHDPDAPAEPLPPIAEAVVGQPSPAADRPQDEAQTPSKPKRKRNPPGGKIGRPRRPGKNLFFCLGFIDPEGKARLSSTSWRTGAYGLRKALATLEWSRKETGDDDYLVVIDPAIGSIKLQGLTQWPTPARGNPEIPTTLDGWKAWAQAHGLPDAEITGDYT